MPHPDQAIVTGAFSYTGRYVARRLLMEGVGVRTLTRNLEREDPFGGMVPALPFDFSDLGENTRFSQLTPGAWRPIRADGNNSEVADADSTTGM